MVPVEPTRLVLRRGDLLDPLSQTRNLVGLLDRLLLEPHAVAPAMRVLLRVGGIADQRDV